MLDSADDALTTPTDARQPKTRIAVSIKQPWATLVVHGLKSIELRRWRPHRTGLIYIHTGAIPEPSEDAWSKLPAEMASAARLRRGLIGRVELTGAKLYETIDEFRADSQRHLAPDSWFDEKGLFGWTFENAEAIPFEPCPGNLRFFRV
jgi:hypothetical protein